MTDTKRRQPVPDRARKRVIRAAAAQLGVSYSVAARYLALGGPDGLAGVELPASRGRTVYPGGSDEHRRWLIDARERRSFDQRVRDTRLAAGLPAGRAEHLVRRFPSTRGEPATGVGALYHGDRRQAALALLYTVVGHERPALLPSTVELAWLADLGEETAVDIACAGVDRAARRVLDGDRWTMWTRAEAAVEATKRSEDRPARWCAVELAIELRDLSLRASVDGARHTLDALLVAGNDGHAPGTRVRVLARPYRGRTATIVGARWASSGPPAAYAVRPDGVAACAVLDPAHLTVLDTPATSALAAT